MDISTGREVRELYGIVRVSRKPDRYRVVEHVTGRMSEMGEKTKRMAEVEARGRNLIASKPGWCAAMRYESEFAPSILCGATVQPYQQCPRAGEHVTP